MKQPIKIPLSKELFDSLKVEEIIYAEAASTGAMGNSGSVVVYFIRNKGLICCETSVYDREETYQKVYDLLLKYRPSSYDIVKGVESHLFSYYAGGMGNHVFVKKGIPLEIRNLYFVFHIDDAKYKIWSSVPGVFYNTVDQMKNS
jgi:hypothetical protein